MLDRLSSFLQRKAGSHGPAILMYHSVRAAAGIPQWPWTVSLRNFRAQLDMLAAGGWKTPTLGELLTAPAHWTGRTVVITFDDGYADNLAAVEELQRHGMRATWFIVSGSIGCEPSWRADGRPSGRLLNAAELRAMHADGMEIGSHTVSHARLTELSETSRLSELEISRLDIENILGCSVSSFAFPYGAWNQDCIQSVQRAGYLNACTTRTGWALRDDDPYLLRRLTVFNTDDASCLARKLYFGDNDVSWKRVWGYFGNRALRHFGRKSA